jgi:hypothetical protein
MDKESFIGRWVEIDFIDAKSLNERVKIIDENNEYVKIETINHEEYIIFKRNIKMMKLIEVKKVYTDNLDDLFEEDDKEEK